MTRLNELEYIVQEIFTYPETNGLRRYIDICLITLWPGVGMLLNHYDPTLATTVILAVFIYIVQVLQYFRGAKRDGGVVRDVG